MSRIAIATFGSLGDLHPFLALALELRRRGHSILFATAEFYRARVEALGLDFTPIGPPVSPEDPAILHRLMRSARGPEYLFRQLFLPHLPQLYRDLEAATRGCDLLVASEVVFAAPILAEKTGIPWVSVLLSPISFLSPYDASVLPPLNWTSSLHDLPPAFHRAFLALPRLAMRRWSAPINHLRRSLGLPNDADALARSKLRAPLVLAMFSRHFAQPQPDWPTQTVQTGFAYFDQSLLPVTPQQQEERSRLDAFLRAGDPPVVFTLGSAAVHAAGTFFFRAAEAIEKLGLRAVFLSGRVDLRQLQRSGQILTTPYASHHHLFPHAAAVVHQAGIGTTAEVLRSGVPSVAVPFNFDQPDNAARLVRLGAAITIARRRWRMRYAYYSVHRLLRDERFRANAETLAALIRPEHGTETACDHIERLLEKV